MDSQYLIWMQPTESGLGDRLIDLSLLLAYARTMGLKLLMAWGRYAEDAAHVSHRVKDIQLENVLSAMNFPADCRIVDAVELRRYVDGRPFNTYLGGGCPQPKQFHAAFVKDVCSYDVFRERLRDVLAEFSFNDTIMSFVAELPGDIVSLHVRRGDKIRPQAFDHTQMSAAQLPDLNGRTRMILDREMESGTDQFFICGDEDEKSQEFVDWIEKTGRRVIKLPAWLEKWQTTYYDLAVMQRSRKIIVSQMYSSFSRFASLLGAKKIEYVYSDIFHDDGW